MKTITELRRLAPVAAVLLAIAGAPIFAQSDTTDVPLPPVAKLAFLRPFLGAYEHTDNYWDGRGPWRGTLDVRPAVKGWYVEFVIDTHYGPIDRENRMILTWDDKLNQYRVWRFETLPPLPPEVAEGTGRFEGEELVMEWLIPPGSRRAAVALAA